MAIVADEFTPGSFAFAIASCSPSDKKEVNELLLKAKTFDRPIDGLTFYPWAPPGYNEGFNGVRTLVLGESTYLHDGDQQKFDGQYEEWGGTWFNGVIQDYREDGPGRYHYWTKWIGAFLGKQKIVAEDKPRVLNRVSFWNFGDIMLPSPRMKIPPEQIPIARERYKKVIAELKPQLVIALCYQLWDLLPTDDGGHRGEPILHFDTWDYDGYKLLCLPHPSAPSVWKFEQVSQAMKIALDQVGGHELK